MLIQVKVHEWPWSFVNVHVLAIRGHADYGHKPVATLDSHRFAKWVLPKPIFLGHEMIYDGDFGCGASVAVNTRPASIGTPRVEK